MFQFQFIYIVTFKNLNSELLVFTNMDTTSMGVYLVHAVCVVNILLLVFCFILLHIIIISILITIIITIIIILFTVKYPQNAQLTLQVEVIIRWQHFT